MHERAHAPRPVRSILRRALLAGAALVVAAAVAAGCAGDDADSPAKLDGGALRWLPADTWLVATGDLSAARIDEALQTLDRLPIWALVEGELPASDGVGMREELLQALAQQSDAELTGEELEQAFGNRVGLAIFDNDLSTLEGDEAPLVGWVHVDDEQLALEAARVLFDGEQDEREHEGVTYFVADEDEATWAVRDELLLVTTTPDRMEQLIDVHTSGDETLADDETAAAVIDAGIGDAVLGAAVATDPVLAAMAGMAREQGDERLAEQVEQALAMDGVDDLVPDWVAGSMTIDDVGLRMRGAWSNPRPLAEPDPTSRELLERMPADAPTASAAVTDGSMLGRAQDAWADVVEATDLDLRELSDCDSRAGREWLCTLGVELALTVLEDEALADAVDAQDDSATVFVQNPLPALRAGLRAAAVEERAGAGAGNRTPTLDAPIYEVATSADAALDWQPPQELVAAMREAGLQVAAGEDGGVTVKVAPGSPLGRMLRTELDAEARASLRMMGVDVARVFTPAGLRLAPEQVDGLSVLGLPADAPSTIAPALAGDVDVLGDLGEYQDVVAAAQPPDEVGSYAWVNVELLVEGVFDALSTETPQLQRALPSVRNNLSDVPGVLAWSSRGEVDGHEVGVAQAVVPVLD